MRTRRKVATAAAAIVLGVSGMTGTGWGLDGPIETDDPVAPKPVRPPGLGRSGVERPPQAETPRIGRVNAFDNPPPQAENP